MRSIAILDASALFAAADRSSAEHASCAQVLRRGDLSFVIPALVVAEAAYLIETRVGAHKEAEFIRGLARFAIEPPVQEDWTAIADLIERYADFPLGTADAATVVLADRIGTDLVVTLDRRHFGALQSPQGHHFRILPEVAAVHEEHAVYSTANP